ncbi:MAG: phage holin family protein [Odoribacter splanchnicus]
MSERNTLSAMVTVFMSSFMDFIEPLKWFLLLGLILIFADLKFGIAAAKKRGEKIRISRAGRRTINKIVDYLCWILVAGAMGKAFGIPFNIPILPAIILLVVCGLEINSVFMNYFEARGKKVKVNIFKYFAKKSDIIDVEEK